MLYFRPKSEIQVKFKIQSKFLKQFLNDTCYCVEIMLNRDQNRYRTEYRILLDQILYISSRLLHVSPGVLLVSIEFLPKMDIVRKTRILMSDLMLCDFAVLRQFQIDCSNCYQNKGHISNMIGRVRFQFSWQQRLQEHRQAAVSYRYLSTRELHLSSGLPWLDQFACHKQPIQDQEQVCLLHSQIRFH